MRPHEAKAEVWLIEGHPLAARYLRQILGAAGITILSGGQPLPDEQDVRSSQTAFVIDAPSLSMPVAKTLRLLSAKFPEAKALVIGRRLAKEELCRLLLLGARGFVPYEEVESKLARAVQRVRDGHLWIPAGVLEELAALAAARQKRKGPAGRPYTARESLIFGLLERRLSNKEIGSALGIAERTVKFHLQNLFAKLGAHDRSSAVELARRSGTVNGKAAWPSGVLAGARVPPRIGAPGGGAK